MKAITQAECNALPIGTKVRVIWSGGNGPHEYTIGSKWSGRSCVDNCYQDPLDFVGAHPMTQVEVVNHG